MNITQSQREFIENIVKECTGYRENEHLLDEFCNEVIRRAYSLVSKQNDLDSIRIYIKRIANAAILDVIKKSKTMSASNQIACDNFKEQGLASIGYEFDENGYIAVNYDISFEDAADKQLYLSEKQIDRVKEIVFSMDEKNNSEFYKNIFELRYLEGLNNKEIAERLGMDESDVDKKLLLMLGKIKEEVFNSWNFAFR